MMEQWIHYVLKTLYLALAALWLKPDTDKDTDTIVSDCGLTVGNHNGYNKRAPINRNQVMR